MTTLRFVQQFGRRFLASLQETREPHFWILRVVAHLGIRSIKLAIGRDPMPWHRNLNDRCPGLLLLRLRRRIRRNAKRKERQIRRIVGQEDLLLGVVIGHQTFDPDAFGTGLGQQVVHLLDVGCVEPLLIVVDMGIAHISTIPTPTAALLHRHDGISQVPLRRRPSDVPFELPRRPFRNRTPAPASCLPA